MQPYKHRQIGTMMLCALGCAAAVAATMVAVISPSPGRIVVGLVLVTLLLCIFIFWSLTVEITSEYLTVWFGPGVIRKVFRFEDIRDARIVKNKWYYGWGIRLTPHGLLFNVSGLDAIELELKNNRKFRIGTDEPQKLLTAIQNVLRDDS